MNAPLREDETVRLRTLKSYRILDTPPESAFDDVALLAAQICKTPIAYVSLIDETRQWFKARVGISTAETARDTSFCAHAIQQPEEILEVTDATQDPRFAQSPLVIASPFVRFYAGAPLVAPDGEALGALCVIDREPRTLTPDQLAALRALSRHAVSQMELRRHSRELVEEMARRKEFEGRLREQNKELERSKTEMGRLLELAEQSRGALLSVLEDEQNTSGALARSNRSLQMLSRCNEALIWARDEPSLLAEICRLAVELGGHRMAWVGYAQDDAEKRIVPMARAGEDTDYLDNLGLTWSGEDPAGRGPAGRCIREARAIAYGDIADPECGFTSAERLMKRGYRSVVCLPIREGGRAFGLIALYSSELRDIAAEELKSLQDLADDLAYGIGALRSRAVRAQAEAALVASLRDKDALLKEVHHRVKNNLQVITSLLRMEGRRIEHDLTKSVLAQMQGRIHSMALLHETLYRSGNFAGVELQSYLGQLAQQLLRAHTAAPGSVRLDLDLAPIQVEIDQAIPCGLIVNELTSNSLKHGLGPGRGDQVRIELRPVADGPQYVLSVSDNGPGIPEDFEAGRPHSLGLQLVSDLARQLQGQLKIHAGKKGATFEVTFTPIHPDSSRTAGLPGV